jgi:bacillithiol system protein YtxJ
VTRTFLTLSDLATLDTAIDRSATHPIVIFKHSPTCGTSARASEELQDWLARTQAPVTVYLVRVREPREVSNAIATRFGIRHESPQLLVIDRSQLRWHGSHFHVNARELTMALERVAEPLAANGR